MIPRPHIVLPIRFALAIAGAAYLARAYVWKAGDLSPEMPQDAIALAALGIVLVFVAWARARDSSDESDSR